MPCFRTAIGLTLLLITPVPVFADKPDAGIKAGKYRIVNLNSGLALDVLDGSKLRGAKLIQADPDPKSESQVWEVVKSNLSFKLLNTKSGRAIDIPNNRRKSGLQLQIWDHHGGLAQQWGFKNYRDKGHVIVTNNGQAVSVLGASKNVGGKIVQLPWSSSPAQVWAIEPVGESKDAD